MKKLAFATGNDRKVGEAKIACEPYGIEIEKRPVQIDEIQHSNPTYISEHKARAAYDILKEPVVVTDTFWSIPALQGFPGAYMKEVADWFKAQDFLNLMKDKEDKRICFSENIVFYDGSELKHFSKEFWGAIVEPRGIGLSIEQVTEIDGHTIGEKRETGGFSHKPEDYVWVDFAKWYSSHK